MAERLFLRLDGDPVYAPETDVPQGTMREFAVVRELAGHVSSILGYREEFAAGSELVERVLPDGAVHLIFMRNASGWTGEVAGPTAAPVLVRLAGDVQGLSVTVRPGAAAAVLGLPARELAGAKLRLEDIWRDAPELLEQVAEAKAPARQAAAVQRALQRRLRDRDRIPSRQAAAAARWIANTAGRGSLREAADAIGVGERRLQQLFSTHVGLSPAAWGRVARLHACLKALREQPTPRWAELALDMGYYDQSHLANEFKSLCGLSPSLFMDRTASGFSKTAD